MMEKSDGHMSEDVLMEILVLLPPESIFRFMSVSRPWRDILSAPSFQGRYAAEASRRGGGRLVAFFQKAAESEHEKSDSMPGKHCNTLPVIGNMIHDTPKNLGHFVNSSNGLILCSRVSGTDVTYHVENPVTGKSVTLPPPHGKRCLVIEAELLDKYYRTYPHRRRHADIRNRSSGVKQPAILSTGLICEEKGYSVVRVGMHRKPKIVYMDCYSSKKGKWSGKRELVATGDCYLREAAPVVANGVFHWYGNAGDIAVYDPKDSKRHLQLIEVPYLGREAHVIARSSAEDDVLWLGLLRKQNLLFYMLPRGEGYSYRRKTNIKSGEWVLMYEVSVNKLSKCLVACKKVTLECLIPESNSQIVALLRQEEKLFLYNLHTTSIHKVHYSGNYNANLPFSPYYTPSSFLSSYYL